MQPGLRRIDTIAGIDENDGTLPTIPIPGSVCLSEPEDGIPRAANLEIDEQIGVYDRDPGNRTIGPVQNRMGDSRGGIRARPTETDFGPAAERFGGS